MTENYGGQIWCKPDEYYSQNNVPYLDLYAIQTSSTDWLILCERHRIVEPPERRGEIIYRPIKRGTLKEVELELDE